MSTASASRRWIPASTGSTREGHAGAHAAGTRDDGRAARPGRAARHARGRRSRAADGRRGARRDRLGPCRWLPLPRAGGRRLRRAAGGRARSRRGAHDAQCRRARPRPCRGRAAFRRGARSRRAHGRRLRGAGLPADLDLRALPGRAQARGREPCSLGRVQRDRLRELGARRAHRALRRLPRHMLRAGRPRAARRSRSMSAACRPRFAPRRPSTRCSAPGSAAPAWARSRRSSACPRIATRTG